MAITIKKGGLTIKRPATPESPAPAAATPPSPPPPAPDDNNVVQAALPMAGAFIQQPARSPHLVSLIVASITIILVLVLIIFQMAERSSYRSAFPATTMAPIPIAPSLPVTEPGTPAVPQPDQPAAATTDNESNATETAEAPTEAAPAEAVPTAEPAGDTDAVAE
ncbi:MAG: hypothetical protein A2498_07180 [Lentisphaerae bacterium RIFOXYC12_FULL_60_16]|nr:MAG: hypothetical protein A2498_07180 [Lentisphaerae bacterium RIFOXYC12_FULL_60_16]